MLFSVLYTVSSIVGAIVLTVAGVLGCAVLVRKLRRVTLSGQPFKGKRVLITGASSGIGRAFAHAVCRAGGSVGLVARRADRLAQVESECREIQVQCLRGGVGANPDVAVVVADVSDPGAVAAAVDSVVASLGGIDLVIANAGRGANNLRFDELDDPELSFYKDVMNVNYWGVLHTVHSALPALKAAPSGGAILAVSSVAGKVATPLRTGYCPTKFAVNAFCESLRFEIGDEVAVTVACPGYVMSEIHDEFLKATGATRNTDKFLSADAAAEIMLTAVLNRDREVVMVPAAVWGLAAKPLIPSWIMDRIVAKSSAAAFSVPDSKAAAKPKAH